MDQAKPQEDAMEMTFSSEENNSVTGVGGGGGVPVPAVVASSLEDDADWEEWDGSSPFWIHCVAGSAAGVVEHAAVYPLDTVRTHIQVCASCVHRGISTNQASAAAGGGATSATTALSKAACKSTTSGTAPRLTLNHHHLPTGMWQTMRFLMNEPTAAAATMTAPSSSSSSTTTSETAANAIRGWSRLWLGVETMLIGCIPAHALYFSAYESVKAATMQDGKVTTWGSSLAGGAAVFCHDVIMTPLDTMKQRMQLGYHSNGVMEAFYAIVHKEGWKALYRSFPITLATNVPYGMVMVSMHEWCKGVLHERAGGHPEGRPSWQTVLMASSVAGLTASAITTPLDRIKTSLQTQELAPACLRNLSDDKCAGLRSAVTPRYNTWREAAHAIYRAEGMAGFGRGLAPRILSHTPAVAISWTTYESAKSMLLSHWQHQ